MSAGSPLLVPTPRRLDGPWRLSLVLALLYLLLCVAGALQTGSGWDEAEHRIYGEMSIDFYRTLGQDRAATTYWTNYYGAFHALVGAAAERLFPWAPWSAARHLGSVAFGLLGFVYCVRLARLLAGPWAGFVAALLLATTPRWTGDAMFNPVDIPTGALYVTALFYLARIAGAVERARLGDWLCFGLAAGLTLAVRAIGLVLLPYATLVIAAWVLAAPRPLLGSLRAHGRRILGGFVLASAVAALVSAALWPRLLVEPVATLLDTLMRTSSYPWPGDVLFRGEFHPGSALPPTYLPLWFAISTPIASLLGLLLAAALCRAWLPLERGALIRTGLLLLALLFPPTYATLAHATIYDGIRHFLFLLPPLTVLAAAGWTASLRRAAQRGRAPLVAGATVLAALAAEPVVWFARSHPYEYTYFNPLVGGLAGASHGYDTDYWGLTLRAAAEALRTHRLELLGKDGHLAVLTNAPWHLIEPWLDDPTKYEKVPPDQSDRPHQILLLWYRTLPVGWEQDPDALLEFWYGAHPAGWRHAPAPVRKCFVVEGQVPFWQTYLVPRFTAGLPQRNG